MPSQPISDLATILMDRELAANPDQFEPKKPFDLGLPQSPEMKPINPELTALLGGAADAASTYTFLKRKGPGHEDNPMFSGMDASPLATAGGVMGTALAMKGARGLMRQHGWGKLADILAATQGNTQLGVAANNLHLNPRHGPSTQAYDKQVHTALITNRNR